MLTYIKIFFRFLLFTPAFPFTVLVSLLMENNDFNSALSRTWLEYKSLLFKGKM